MMHLSEKQPDHPWPERDFSSVGGAPLPARFPSATSASARALASLSLSSSRSSGTAAAIPGCRGPRRPRCHAARLRTKWIPSRVPATRAGMASGCSGSTRASAAAAHTRTKLTESHKASVSAGTASRAVPPISASACAAKRRSSGSLLFSAATQSAVATPRYDGRPNMHSLRGPSGRAPQPTVQIERGTDQSHMRERLRKVAQRLARRPRLLGVQPQVVRVGQHLLEDEPRLLQPAGARQRLDQPERTHVERPLAAGQPVAGAPAHLVAPLYWRAI